LLANFRLDAIPAMNYETWSPVYEEILADFGFGREADEQARDELARLLSETPPFDLDRLDVTGETVAIAGAGPSLTGGETGEALTGGETGDAGTKDTGPGDAETGDADPAPKNAELDRVREADAVFAASTAAEVLRDEGVEIDCVVTDLDGTPETAQTLTESGTPVAAHAHGDNVAQVRHWIPRFDAEHVLATTQARPVGPVRNFGGFTDGDRAAFLADHLGAAELTFVGWDLDDPQVGEMKTRKLRWAARLLRWLELRRCEEFAVLDDRRDELDVRDFPV
jgi:uncharacterized Rossmann fold enzyme